MFSWISFVCTHSDDYHSLSLCLIDFSAGFIGFVGVVTFFVIFSFLQFSYNDVFGFRWMKIDFSYLYARPPLTSPRTHPPTHPTNHPPPPHLPVTFEVSSGGSSNDGVIDEPSFSTSNPWNSLANHDFHWQTMTFTGKPSFQLQNWATYKYLLSRLGAYAFTYKWLKAYKSLISHL